MKNAFDDRELRLECIKLAAMLTMQLKASQKEVEPLARLFLKFVTEADVDTRR